MIRVGATIAAVLGVGLVAPALAAPSSIDHAATATAPADRLTPPPPDADHFPTLPPGAPLPSDATCAAQVRPTPEVRAANASFNQTRGVFPVATLPRVTGDFVGTTDEIIQWAACKWGIDENVVRAQVVKESWWQHDTGGDLTTDQSICAPPLRTGSGTCPESYGLGQVRYQYHLAAFEHDNAIRSSAFNLDYVYFQWRNCFEGQLTWLNTVDRGEDYVAGDLWGCVGVHFSGRWKTAPANTYIASVQDLMTQRMWETPNFLAAG